MSGLYARTKGGGAKTIVLLHGFAGNHGDWADIQAELARDAQVIAYDLPGHGKSLDQPGAGQAMAAAKAVLADLDARGIDRAHIAGFSMGGAIAALIGMRAPDRVASLTLVAPGGFGPDINGPLLDELAAATYDRLGPALNAMAAPGFQTLTRDIAATAAIHGAPGQRAKLAEIAGLIAKDSRQGEIPREQLAKLPMPVTVLWGDLDPVLPYHQTQGLPPAFQLETVAGAGHMLLVEARRAVTSAIRRNSRN